MTILKNELEMLIPKENIKYNEQMSKHTSFKTGGIADYYITAKNENEVKKVLEFANKNDIPLHIIGNGSNILVQDDGIRGIVLKIEIQKLDIQENEKNEVIVTVGAGVKIMWLAQILKQKENKLVNIH